MSANRSSDDARLSPITLEPLAGRSERQAKAREYAVIRRRLFVADLALGLAYLLVAAFSGLSPALRDALSGWLIPGRAAPGWGVGESLLVAGGFILVFGGVYTLLTFPISLYGYRLGRRYGLSTQSGRAWLLDYLKGLALGGVFSLAVGLLVYWLILVQPALWWLWAAVALLFLTVVLAQLTPVLLVPLFYKLTPIPDSDELSARLRELAARAGASIKGVYSIALSQKTTAANAALMGLGSTRSIVLGDTLLDRYTQPEIEVIFAHELGHHVHRDIPKMVLAQSALTLVGLYLVDIGLTALLPAIGLGSKADPAALPLVALGLGLFSTITTPFSNWFSRQAESAADLYALELTKDPAAFIQSMSRLADQNLSELRPPEWIEALLYDHPSIGKRIDEASAWAKERGVSTQVNSVGDSIGDGAAKSVSADGPHGKEEETIAPTTD